LNASEGLARILPANARILVIGVGNEYRSDDAVGILVARRLRELSLNSVTVIEKSGEGTELMESWKNADNVILVDAVASGAKPGMIHHFDARAHPIPTSYFRCSTHAFGVGEAIELARTLNQLPSNLTVFGIEGKIFNAGTGLSLDVQEAMKQVLELVLLQIRAAGQNG
jgi:hydrogenase maturation protease